jgi:sugar/nucleoside kinase (ribokinase family)
MAGESTLYDVATIGNYTKDTVVAPAGTRQVDGGGVRYSAFAAAGLGRTVATITRLAAEDCHVVDELEQAGIDVFPEFTLESTLMRLEYPSANVDERILSVAATAGSFTPDQVRSIDAKAFVITASIRGEVPIAVIRELRATGATIALDVQGFVRIRRSDGRLVHAPWPEKSDVLGLVDVLKADAVEAESVTGESDPETAARALTELGPREIVLTHRDGLLVLADGDVHEAPFHPKKLVGRSGRGDTCLGSYVAMRLSVAPAEATVWAAAVTSLKMEADGPFRSQLTDVIDLIETKYDRTLEIPAPVAGNPVTTTRGLDTPEMKRRA